MSSKKLLVLTIIAVLLGVAAVKVLGKQEQATEVMEQAAVAPGLEEKIPGIDHLIFTSAKQSSDVVLGEGGAWGVKQLDGYPADKHKIRQVLYRLAASKRMEKKTSNPDLLGKLSLSDDLAMRIQLFAKGEEKPLLDILTGDGDKTFKGTYIRAAGDNQSWLVSEDLTYGSAPLGWVDEVIINLDRARVWQIRINHKGLPPVEIDRKTPGGDFLLKNLPENANQDASHYDVYTVGTALENMKLANVAKADALPDAITTTAHFLTVDGLEVQVDIAPEKIEGQHWAKVSARFVPEAIQESAEAKKLSKKPEEVQQEAEAINARTSGWIYKLAPTPYKQLMKTMDDFAEKKPSTPDKAAN